jgi:predicted site-specific integrase-resolvase
MFRIKDIKDIENIFNNNAIKNEYIKQKIIYVRVSSIKQKTTLSDKLHSSKNNFLHILLYRMLVVELITIKKVFKPTQRSCGYPADIDIVIINK